MEADEAADRKRALADLILQQESMPQKRDREEDRDISEAIALGQVNVRVSPVKC